MCKLLRLIQSFGVMISISPIVTVPASIAYDMKGLFQPLEAAILI